MNGAHTGKGADGAGASKPQARGHRPGLAHRPSQTCRGDSGTWGPSEWVQAVQAPWRPQRTVPVPTLAGACHPDLGCDRRRLHRNSGGQASPQVFIGAGRGAWTPVVPWMDGAHPELQRPWRCSGRWGAGSLRRDPRAWVTVDLSFLTWALENQPFGGRVTHLLRMQSEGGVHPLSCQVNGL